MPEYTPKFVIHIIYIQENGKYYGCVLFGSWVFYPNMDKKDNPVLINKNWFSKQKIKVISAYEFNMSPKSALHEKIKNLIKNNPLLQFNT